MCLATPALIEKLDGDVATVALGGARSQIMTTLVAEAKVGDWVLVHAGYAIAIIPEDEAKETFALLQEMEGLSDREGH